MNENTMLDKEDIASRCEQLACECDRLARRIEGEFDFTSQAIYSAASCLYDAAAMQRARRGEHRA